MQLLIVKVLCSKFQNQTKFYYSTTRSLLTKLRSSYSIIYYSSVNRSLYVGKFEGTINLSDLTEMKQSDSQPS